MLRRISASAALALIGVLALPPPPLRRQRIVRHDFQWPSAAKGRMSF